MNKFMKTSGAVFFAAVLTACGGWFAACASSGRSATEIVRDVKSAGEQESLSGGSDGSGGNGGKETGADETAQDTDQTQQAPYYAEFYADGVRVSRIFLLNGQLTEEEPIVPKKRGYTGNWEEYRLAAGESATIEAEYRPVEYSVEYHTYGGDNAEENPEAYTVETPAFTFAEPTRRGYAFCGWYADDAFSRKIDGVTENSVGNIELYAKCELIGYSVTYETAGGKNAAENPSSYTVESGTVTLFPAEREGYEFIGWRSNGLDICEIPAGSTGNLVLTAQWRAEDTSNTGNTGNTGDTGEPSVYAVKNGELTEDAIYFVFGIGETSLSVAENVVYAAGCSGEIYRSAGKTRQGEAEYGEAVGVISADDLVDGENVFYLIVQKENGATRTYTLYVYKQYYVTVSYYYNGTRLAQKQVLADEEFIPSCDVSETGGKLKGWKYGSGAKQGEEIAAGEKIVLTEDTMLCAVIEPTESAG
ncbi:MAG: InlB B-repeat-containing protein [Candidatus Scatosoma sp.]